MAETGPLGTPDDLTDDAADDLLDLADTEYRRLTEKFPELGRREAG